MNPFHSIQFLSTIVYAVIIVHSLAVQNTAHPIPRPNPTARITGYLYERCGGGGYPGTVHIHSYGNDEFIDTTITADVSGRYEVELSTNLDTVVVSVRNYEDLIVGNSVGLVHGGTVEHNFVLGNLPSIDVAPDTSPPDLQPWPAYPIDNRRVTIHAFTGSEVFPLLSYIFFDQGRSALPSRYHRLAHPSLTAGFDERMLPPSQTEQYFHLLDIIGSRLRKHPATSVQLVGCNSKQPELGEVLEVSAARAHVVREYLTGIWGIDTARVRLLPPRDYPEERSNIKDPLGIQENRRVEIRSNDWEIMRPVIIDSTRRYPYPESVYFNLDNGSYGGMVERRRIEVYRNDRLWDTLGYSSRTDTISELFFWQREFRPPEQFHNDFLPRDEVPYTARLHVWRYKDRECSSPDLSIPVTLHDAATRRAASIPDSTLRVFTLIRFKFDSPEPGPLNERIIRDVIAPAVTRGARVTIIGHSEVIGLDDRSSRLPARRAQAVAKRLQGLTGSASGVTMRVMSVGELTPLFSQEYPEGRFLNRCVQVWVVRPSDR